MWMFLLVSAVLGAVGSDNAPSGAVGSEKAPSGAPQSLRALHCPPCERIHCVSRRAHKLQCKGGVTMGICGCCPACARTAGETCGGTWDYLGKCDEGLVCVYHDSSDGKPDAEREGICEAVIGPPEAESCHPECTRAYCHANPSGTCSARSVSLEKQTCRGLCQHTSCSSCLVLKPPPCPQTCAPSDPSCLHRFGRCVHNHLSAPHHPLYHQNLQNDLGGYFVCLVPNCPIALK